LEVCRWDANKYRGYLENCGISKDKYRRRLENSILINIAESNMEQEIREHLIGFKQRQVVLDTRLKNIEETISAGLRQNEIIIEKVNKLFPVYEDITGWGDFFRRGKQLGLGVAIFFTTAGIIIGSVYAIKEWFKK